MDKEARTFGGRGSPGVILMHRGYVKMYRKLEDWEWYDDLKLVGFFVHLLLSANFNENRYHGYKIPRGSLVFGRKSAAKRFGVGERSIRTMLTKLKATNEVTIKTTNRFSIVCIVNYEKYQETTTSKTTNQQSHKRPTTDQQPTTLKEVKKLRSKEEERGASLHAQDFLTSLKSNDAYKGIDLDREIGKCKAWCLVNNKVLSQRRFVNWLNRMERPILKQATTPQNSVESEEQMKKWKAEAAPMPEECRVQLEAIGIRSKI